MMFVEKNLFFCLNLGDIFILCFLIHFKQAVLRSCLERKTSPCVSLLSGRDKIKYACSQYCY